jgi:outer membrane protein assembly factor BamB
MIALLLMISIGTSVMFVQSTSAHGLGQGGAPWQIPTHAYIIALPDPVGVGQKTTIYMFLGNLPFDGAALNNDYRYRNYNLAITAPDGTVQTQNFSYISDPTNSQYFPYTPNQVGTYILNFTYGGQNINDYDHANDAYVNDTYMPSSGSATLTVQQEPIANLPDNPLPSAYWTRPIYGENTNWWSISSNWLGAGIAGYGAMPGPNELMFPGDAVGPQTGHVMWTKPLQFGGVVGGNNFQIQGNQYFEGSAYNERFVNPIIINGILYYNEPRLFTGVSSFTGSNGGPTDAVDLRTGQLIWSRKDIPAISFALVYDHEDPDQHGIFPPILFTSNFARGFDAVTGDPVFNVTSPPSGTSVRGPNGEILKYVMTNLGNTTNPNYVLAEWNSTKLWNYVYNPYSPATSLLSPSIINSTGGIPGGALITALPIPVTGTTGTLPNGTSIAVPYGSTIVVNAGVFNSTDPQNRYDWNYSIGWRNTMTPAPSILTVFPGNLLLCRNGSYPALGAYNPYTYFAVNLNASRGNIGDVLWYSTINPPSGTNITTITYAGADAGAGVFVESYRETMQFVGYSLTDGHQIWGPNTPQSPLDYYGSQGPGTLADVIAYGRIYSSAYAGIIYCYDMKTGNILWTYGNGGVGNSTNSGFEVPGPYATFVNAVGNGIIYTVSSEHTVETPIYKGALMRGINATDGTEVFTLSNDNNEFGDESFAIADGYAATFNAYDSQIYSVGRGPSATTVSAPNVGISFGAPLVIKGSVKDISAGTQQSQQAADFPNGVPVSSDASMKDWMGYVYQQKPLPTDFTGVPVTLYVLDSNNNYRSIGTATTDASGTYRLTWTPDIPGSYTVFANFQGTNGYWPSTAEDGFTVMQALATPTPAPAPLATMTDTYLLGSTIAIIIAVLIVGMAIVLTVRKRP